MVDKISSGRILILGDGNLSFSKAFVDRISSTSKSENGKDAVMVTASVLNTEPIQIEKYPESKVHIEWLKNRSNASIIFGLDATRLESLREDLGHSPLYDSVIFNFPHVGGKTNLRKSRQLLLGVFMSVKQILAEEGRFYLTLAHGQSGLQNVNEEQEAPQLPVQKRDSWRPLHLAAYAQLIAEDRKPCLANEWTGYGYNCSGYKDTFRRFNTEKAETIIFRKAYAMANVETVFQSTVFQRELDCKSNFLHPLRPYYIHDISVWARSDFRCELFLETAISLAKGLIKLAEYLEQHSGYTKLFDEEGEKCTYCFRFFWQSSDAALTCEGARDLQLYLRKMLPEILWEKHQFRVELR